MLGFIDFIRKQGVVGLAIGFILGGAVSKLVSAFVDDIVNPVIGLALGKVSNLAEAVISIGPINILWGHFISVFIDFLIIALVIYYGFKVLRLDQLDKKE
jgi:large conductance mechanosensitive channel